MTPDHAAVTVAGIAALVGAAWAARSVTALIVDIAHRWRSDD